MCICKYSRALDEEGNAISDHYSGGFAIDIAFNVQVLIAPP